MLSLFQNPGLFLHFVKICILFCSANRQFPANRTSANTLMVLFLQSLPIVVVAAVVGNVRLNALLHNSQHIEHTTLQVFELYLLFPIIDSN